MKKRYNISHQNSIFLIFFIFSIIYGLISLVNHYELRTSALDLGVFNHAVYSFAHFKKVIFTLGIDGQEMPFLGTHFSPIMFLYSPFYYLFGSYTLLVIQIAAILFGGFGIYKYSLQFFDKDSWITKLILIQFFSIWGIYSALSFDFHNNVVASMLVIWFVYFLEKRKYTQSVFFWMLIVLSQENMAIWMMFILIGLMIKNRKQFAKDFYKLEISLSILTLIYAIAVIGYIMPLLQNSGANLQFTRYSNLGSTAWEIIGTILKRPFYSISLLFKNITADPLFNGIKTEFHFIMLISGGIFIFLRPAYLLMLIPIYAQKFLSNEYSFWGINLQYSIEFVPIISLAFIDFLRKQKKYQLYIAILITVLTITFNIDSMNHRKSKWYNKENTVFYSRKHYDPKLNLKEIKSALKIIDCNSAVSASSVLVPRLAFRDKIYHFPIIKDAKYIVLITENRSTYPLSQENFNLELTKLRDSSDFKNIYEADSLIIFERENQ